MSFKRVVDTDSITHPKTIKLKNMFPETRAHCHQVTNTEVDYLHIGIVVVMYVIPAILVVILYIGILYISSVSIGRVQQFRTNEYQLQGVSVFSRPNMASSVTPQSQILRNVTEHQTRTARLWTSISTLVGCFLGVTIPVCSIEIYLSVSESNMILNITLLLDCREVRTNLSKNSLILRRLSIVKIPSPSA
jgi:hypothetical protein